MKNILLLVAISIFIISCKNTNKKEGNSTSKTEQKIVDLHTSKQNLNWSGSYFGTLPCASCPGIKIFINIENDLRFEKTTEYIDSDIEVETVRGRFTWSEDGSYISLDGDNYKIGENTLILLDKDNNEIQGELANDYILRKTSIKECTDFTDGFFLYYFEGDDGNNYSILYNTETKTPTALIEAKDIKITLPQTQAWAKGAEYKKGDYKLVTGKDNTILFIKGKKISLKEK